MAEPRRAGAGRDSDEPKAELRGHRGGLGDASPPELDRLIHERMRLGIVSALAVNDQLSFNELKTMLRASDGNLSVHARKLEDAGYIECLKTFHGRVPHTDYRLTPLGRREFTRYLDHMEALIEAVREP